MTPPHRPYAEPQAIPSLDDLGFGFPTLDGSSFLPVVHPSPPYIPSHEECKLTPFSHLIRPTYSPSTI